MIKIKFQSMVLLCVGLAMLMAIPLVRGQEDPQTPPKRFSFDAGGYVKTTNFEDTRTGVLIGGTGYFTDNIGVSVDARLGNTSGPAFDETHADIMFRINESPNASLAVYTGGLRDWHVDEWGIEAGLRGDVGLFGPLGGFAKVGWEKYLDADHDHAAVGVLGLSLKF